jgi:hypothetical protein
MGEVWMTLDCQFLAQAWAQVEFPPRCLDLAENAKWFSGSQQGLQQDPKQGAFFFFFKITV